MTLSDRFFRAQSHRKDARARLNFIPLEDRIQPTASPFRTIDGTMNNLVQTNWGSAGSTQLRIAPNSYADGIFAPTSGRPDAREVSNVVADQGTDDIVSSGGLSAMIYAWGQFLDHDLDLTPTGSVSFNIAMPTGDAYFDPNSTGTQVIPLKRSLAATGTGAGTGNVQQEINNVTAWLDGSQIYGSDTATADSLRTHVGGQLKTSAGNLLPTDGSGNFLAGDIRVNENIELISMQTLFVREHNRIAAKIQSANPSLSDEQVYQLSRQQVIAELQVITYQEWLPTLLGKDALKPYRGYSAKVNPGIATEFSTSAFRLGHSMLGDDVEFLNNNGEEVAPSISLAQAFFNPSLVNATGIDPILKYLTADPSSEIDTKVVGSVRNFLFGPPGAGGLDLASLNIQRGRDHGLADYNSMRRAYGLPKVTSFAQITSNFELQQKLESLYGTVDNIDAWVGGLAEDHVPGTNTGPLIRRVLADQFERLRDGDRFWYERVFSGQQLDQIKHTTLSAVIARNTTTTNVQSNAFLFKVAIHGNVFADMNQDKIHQPIERGVGHVTVQLINAEDNSVVASTVTTGKGDYYFDVEDGLGVGTFKVQIVTPTGVTQTSGPTGSFVFTKGDVNYDHVDFGVLPPMMPPPPPQGGGSSSTPMTPPQGPPPPPPPMMPPNGGGSSTVTMTPPQTPPQGPPPPMNGGGSSTTTNTPPAPPAPPSGGGSSTTPPSAPPQGPPPPPSNGGGSSSTPMTPPSGGGSSSVPMTPPSNGGGSSTVPMAPPSGGGSSSIPMTPPAPPSGGGSSTTPMGPPQGPPQGPPPPPMAPPSGSGSGSSSSTTTPPRPGSSIPSTSATSPTVTPPRSAAPAWLTAAGTQTVAQSYDNSKTMVSLSTAKVMPGAQLVR